MSRVLGHSLRVIPMILGATILVSAAGNASEAQEKTEQTQPLALDVQSITPTTFAGITQAESAQLASSEAANPVPLELTKEKTALRADEVTVPEIEFHSTPIGQVTSVSELTQLYALEQNNITPTPLAEIPQKEETEFRAGEVSVPKIERDRHLSAGAEGNRTKPMGQVTSVSELRQPDTLEQNNITPTTITEIAPTQTAQSASDQVDNPVPLVPMKQETTRPAGEVTLPGVRRTRGSNPMGQVTSVSELSDVQPGDWAFEALRALVERYGCIAGYPDGTYRGNRAMTRYEFAAGLNACLNRINELILANTEAFVTREDLATLQRLREEFATELTTLSGRVDLLEGRAAALEDNLFSTTTKLNAEIIFNLSSVIDGDRANGEEASDNVTFSDRVRINFDTSFTGKDLLRTRIQANNIVPYNQVIDTFEGRLGYDGNNGNDAILGLLLYRFPLSPQTTAYIAGAGNAFVDFDVTFDLNPFFEGAFNGISRYSERNPIYNYIVGAGAGLRHKFSDSLELGLGYLASDAGNANDGRALFDGKYAALAQLTFSPSNRFKFGVIYLNTYSPSDPNPSGPPPVFGSGSGSILANSNFGTAVVGNIYSVAATYRFNPSIVLNGWVGYGTNRYIGRGDSEIFYWTLNLGFPDLGKKGNLAGISVGMEPRVIDLSQNLGEDDQDTSLHVEAFYKYQINPNIAITPGVIWITAPNFDNNNDDVVIGVLRTVFRL